MVVDTSALAAILFREPDADIFDLALADAPILLLSAVTRVELSLVIEDRKREAGRADLEVLLRDARFDIVSVVPPHAEIAIDAFRRFGKGRHRAALNIGDCFSYALAAATGPTHWRRRPGIHCSSRAITSATPTSGERCRLS